MATAKLQPTALHQHYCTQHRETYFCDEGECRPTSPGTTNRVCEACASNPKTLLELKRELADGRNELYNQFFASVTEQVELNPEQQQTLGSYLAGNLEKRDKLADFIKGIEEEANRLRERERQMAERRQEFEKLARLFRSATLFRMQNWQLANGQCTAITRADGLEASFRVRRNPAKVEIYDEAEIPGKFINYQPVPDKAAILEALQKGEKVPGARIADQTYSLQIR